MTTELTEAEWAIMKVIWDRENCTAPDVQEALLKSRNWSPSTVRTMMDRMVKKNILHAKKIRNLTFYEPAITRVQAQKQELRYTLENAFSGAMAPMIQCLLGSEKISAEEIAEIEKLIKTKKKGA